MGWFAELFEGEVQFTDYESDPSWWLQTRKLPKKKEGSDFETVEVPTIGEAPEVPHTPKEVTPKKNDDTTTVEPEPAKKDAEPAKAKKESASKDDDKPKKKEPKEKKPASEKTEPESSA